MQVSVKLPMGKSHMKRIEIILPWETQQDTIIFGTGGKQYLKVVWSFDLLSKLKLYGSPENEF